MTSTKKILTKNKEIYNKFNSLYFMSEIVLTTASDAQLNKILYNINKERLILSKEKIGQYILIKKMGPIDFSVYLQKN
jgi:hypothetical protein